MKQSCRQKAGTNEDENRIWAQLQKGDFQVKVIIHLSKYAMPNKRTPAYSRSTLARPSGLCKPALPQQGGRSKNHLWQRHPTRPKQPPTFASEISLPKDVKGGTLKYQLKFCIRDSEGLKSTVIRSGMVIIFPVFGWRTFFEDRFSLVKEPKPRKDILFPFLMSSVISAKINFMISWDSTWVRKNLFEMARVSSPWFTPPFLSLFQAEL